MKWSSVIWNSLFTKNVHHDYKLRCTLQWGFWYLSSVFWSHSRFLHPGDWSDPDWRDGCSSVSRRIQQRAALQGLWRPPRLSDIKNVSKANVSLFSAPYRFVFFPAEVTVSVPLQRTIQGKWSVSVCICARLSMCTCLAANLCHCNRIALKWISTHSCAHSDHEPNDDKLFLFPDSLLLQKSNEF